MPNPRHLLIAAALGGLLLTGACAHRAGAVPSAGAPSTSPLPGRVQPPAAGPSRDRWLQMFARGYFPGRSGQIFLVPREGDFFIDRDPLYRFMHGSPWDYDVHIPLLLHGASIKAGTYADPALQQDLAPTLATLIGLPPLPTMTGRPLSQALQPAGPRPRVVLLLVLDAMRADYFDGYAAQLPTLGRLRREGAWFANTRINYLPTLTSIGHATVGTGADPRLHGLAANNLFNRVTGKAQPAYEGLDPRELMVLTLADAWNLATDGKAIIAGQGGAIRATAGLVGHGACLVNGRPVIAASYATRDAGWETNPQCYRMPDYLKTINGKTFWSEAGGRWMGHDVANPNAFRASSLFQRFEGEALVAVATSEAFGNDEVTDLLMVNMKGPDYVAHAYGPDSAEMKEEMSELDRQVTRLIDVLGRKAGPSGLLVAITADHGMPPEPPDGRRHYLDDVVTHIHERLDPNEKKLVTYFGDAANNEIYLDANRLHALGLSLNDVAALLASEPYLAAVFTEDEVRAAQPRLEPR